MTIRYKYSDGTIKEFEDRDALCEFLESCDTKTARELRLFGVDFYYDPLPCTELLMLVAEGHFEGTTQRDFLKLGLDALVEDLHNGREKDDWLFEKLMIEKDD